MFAFPKRSLFNYSLRTLFAVTTVVCVWLGYQLNWMRQRRVFIADETSVRERHPSHARWSATISDRGSTPPRAPGLLWAFGEDGFSEICVLVEASASEGLTEGDVARVREARELFPEAMIGTVHVTETPLDHVTVEVVPID